MHEVRRAEFGQDILQATQSGVLTRSGDALCAKVGEQAMRYGSNEEYVLLVRSSAGPSSTPPLLTPSGTALRTTTTTANTSPQVRRSGSPAANTHAPAAPAVQHTPPPHTPPGRGPPYP